MADAPPIVVTGAAGRIGRLLRTFWPSHVHWLTRNQWDILNQPAPDLPNNAVWLDLAGHLKGNVVLNPRLADRVTEAAQSRNGRVIYMSSASVYPGGTVDMDEAEAPNPASDYGRSKMEAEAIVRRYPSNRVLRLGNLAGADALLGPGPRTVVLDPVPGQSGGPIRSYIGPHVLADVLWTLCNLPADRLPPVLNLAQAGGVAMGDLLGAAGFPWSFGPPRVGVLGRAVMSVRRLSSLVSMPDAEAGRIVADLRTLQGWPT